MVRVSAGARLHFGFCNLSLSHERLYGALGLALAEPRVVVEAVPADAVSVAMESGASPEVDAVRADVREYATVAADLLDVAGASVTVHAALPRHAGLGSGTQLAAATLTAVARAHDREPRVRERAPGLGRGGRSGVGVAAFESGGFVLDAGHPTARFTTDRPPDGEWTVPPVAARHRVPADWRFLLVRPAAEPGRSGDAEDAAMRAAVERADSEIADRIAGIVTRRVLPAAATGRAEAFGAAVAAVGRLNGAWYADEQGGVYRPPAGRIIDVLSDVPAVRGVGQSSWGPAVYGVTDVSMASEAASAAERALSELEIDGRIHIAAPRNRGVDVNQLR